VFLGYRPQVVILCWRDQATSSVRGADLPMKGVRRICRVRTLWRVVEVPHESERGAVVLSFRPVGGGHGRIAVWDRDVPFH
jgi:hypothetical protein